jgi:hypothetical protein
LISEKNGKTTKHLAVNPCLFSLPRSVRILVVAPCVVVVIHFVISSHRAALSLRAEIESMALLSRMH